MREFVFCFSEVRPKMTIIPCVKLLRPRASPRGRETGRLFRSLVASFQTFVRLSVLVRPTITSRSSPCYDFVTFGTFNFLQTGAVACNRVMENRSLTLYFRNHDERLWMKKSAQPSRKTPLSFQHQLLFRYCRLIAA